MGTLPDAVRQFIAGRGLTGRGVAAVSGGADSVALLRALREAEVGSVVVAHVNHHLRGEESDGDEAFVCELAASLGIECYAATLPVLPSENVEASARRLRYDFLRTTADAVGGSWIATGHTADDQAETVLHRLIRGSGIQGLRGIAVTKFSGEAESPERSAGHRPALRSEDSASPLNESVSILRPLLRIHRHDVLAYLAAIGQNFRIDATNADERFTRNRIRHTLLPQLKEFNPEVVAVLGRLAEQADEVFAHLDHEAAGLLARAERPRAGEMLILDAGTLAATPVVLVREAFRRLWQREGWPMDGMTFAHWRRAAALTPGDYPGGVRLRVVGPVVQVWRTR